MRWIRSVLFFGGRLGVTWSLLLTVPIQSVPFQVLNLGPPPLTERWTRQPQVWVFTSDQAWQQFWRGHRGIDHNGQPPAAPPVDFRRQAVIGLTVGARPTGGYGLKIDRIERATGNRGVYWRVHYTESVPGPNCLVTQAITTPTVFIAVQPPVPQVQLRGRTVTISCR